VLGQQQRRLNKEPGGWGKLCSRPPGCSAASWRILSCVEIPEHRAWSHSVSGVCAQWWLPRHPSRPMLDAHAHSGNKPTAEAKAVLKTRFPSIDRSVWQFPRLSPHRTVWGDREQLFPGKPRSPKSLRLDIGNTIFFFFLYHWCFPFASGLVIFDNHRGFPVSTANQWYFFPLCIYSPRRKITHRTFYIFRVCAWAFELST
jgi:hypothetical protein